MSDDIKTAFIFLFLGISNFLAFAYDIENDRDFMTWMWLLASLMNLGKFLACYIIDKIKKYHGK